MKCVVNWVPLRIHVCSRNTQPHLELRPKGGAEIAVEIQAEWSSLRVGPGINCSRSVINSGWFPKHLAISAFSWLVLSQSFAGL